MTDPKKNNPTTAVLATRLTIVEGQQKNQDDRVDILTTLVNDMRVQLARLEVQFKITWALQVIIIGSLISLAFSISARGAIP